MTTKLTINFSAIMMKKLTTTLLLLVLASPSMAQTSVQVHGFSMHTHGAGWNERNTGLGIRHQISTDFAVQAGFYKNSEFGNTAYGIAEYMPFHWYNVSAGAFAGVATGYKQNPDGIPVAGFALRVYNDTGNVAFKFVPKVPQSASGVFSVEIGFNF